MSKQQVLLQQITDAVESNTLLKITLGNKRDKTTDLKNVFIKAVLIKEQPHLSFIYRHTTKDITKNFVLTEAIKVTRELLETSFYNADVYTSTNTIYYSIVNDGKEKLVTKNNDVIQEVQSLSHDKQKNRIIQKKAVYLNSLGITSAEGNVKKEMQHKYKQINRYVEIIEGILKDAVIEKDFSVVDMGSGKGYLTFALYDYLQHKYDAVKVTGIEMREDLVLKCNDIAAQTNYTNLHFERGSINETPLAAIDMLIALHACDTATDDAIAKGIKANAKYIICAPCCHKQVRRQMAPNNALKLITKHGILMERQAEMVTDTIRALVLEAYGYKTKVFDFIEEEDTPKNVLIVGTKNNLSENIFKENMDKVQELKNMFGIKEHYLEGVV
ncbi:MAG: class I SAM-dependent methyltransferase [Ferruginibacter sp.]